MGSIPSFATFKESDGDQTKREKTKGVKEKPARCWKHRTGERHKTLGGFLMAKVIVAAAVVVLAIVLYHQGVFDPALSLMR